MKKPTKPTSGKSKVSKHAKSSAKPVTLDLKAEKVEAKEASPSPTTRAAKKNTARSSVPKSSDKSSMKKSESSPFGRKSEDAKPPVETAKPSNAVKQDAEESIQKPNPEKNRNKKSSGKFIPALIGGAVALTGAAVLQTTGILPSSSNSETAFVEESALTDTRQELLNKIDALEKQLTATNNQSDIDALLDKKIAELAKTNQSTESTDGSLDEISMQVNETTIRVERLQSEVAQISKSLSDLNTAVSSGEAGDNAAVIQLNSQVETISQKLETYSSNVTTLKAETAELAAKSSSPTGESEKTISAIATLETALPALKVSVSEQISTLQSSLSDRLNGLEEQTSKLSGSVNDMRDAAAKDAQTNVKTARAIAAAALKNDIDSGRSFIQSLETLVALADNDDSLTALKEFATTGIPTSDQIRVGFEALKPELLASLKEKPAEDLKSRLLAGAKSLVKIQSLDPAPASGSDGNIASISSKLSDNDLIGAENTWAQLPPQAKEISSKWHEAIQARITVDGLISNTIQTYLTSVKNPIN